MVYDDLGIDIKDVQRVQLELLIELDRICKKNDILYQLFAGTLLGAIRHNGFIPWDDDIDVCLLREDYERFIECCKEDLGDQYFLQHCSTDKKSVLTFAKIRKNDTILTNEVMSNTGQHNGIWIDVFPLDNVKQGNFVGKLQVSLFLFLARVNSARNKNKISYEKNVIKKLGRMMLFCISKAIPKKVIDSLIYKVCCMYKNDDTAYVSLLYRSPEITQKCLRKRDTFYDIVYAEFEGCSFPIPRNYDEVLTRHYGDYMRLPPEEERYPQHRIVEAVVNTTSGA